MLRLNKTLFVLLFLATPAVAFDITEMTDAEREAFRAEVRAYMLEYPELFIEVIGVLENRNAASKREADKQMIYDYALEIFDDGYSYVGGNPEGTLRIVEFVDYRCGYCRKAHPEINDILTENDDIRFIVKELPVLGEDSVTAARFAIATRMLFGGYAYKQVQDALFNLPTSPSDAVLERLANELGLDADAILVEMTADAVSIEIFRNQVLADAMEITGTPAFIAETEMMRGYVPKAQFELILDAVREEMNER